jgi:biopolymer transport protein TolQ
MSSMETHGITLDPIALLTSATLPVKITVGLLIVASTFVWAVAALKSLQLRTLRAREAAFEAEAAQAQSPVDLHAAAQRHPKAAGARVVAALGARPLGSSAERLTAVAERAVVAERQRASALVTPLGTIASVSPFVGLFGTVYGIMDAFVRIGAEKSASLPVVAPAIGEALLTTAIGLACAIPAVAVYNAIDKRIGDYLDELDASAGEWVALHAPKNQERQEAAAFPLVAHAAARHPAVR